MKKLEDKILDKVYKYETRHTAFDLFVRVGIIFISGGFAILVAVSILEIFFEQQTFELLKLLQEDSETIHNNLFDTLSVIYQETPHAMLVVFIITFLLAFFALIMFIKHFHIIKRKVRSIIYYWLKY